MASQYFCISVLLYFLYLGLAGCARTEAVGWWLWGHHGTIALHGLPPLLQLARILFASRLSRNLFPPSSQLICWNLASCNHGSMARTGLHHLLQLRRTGRFFAKSVSILVSAFFSTFPHFFAQNIFVGQTECRYAIHVSVPGSWRFISLQNIFINAQKWLDFLEEKKSNAPRECEE